MDKGVSDLLIIIVLELMDFRPVPYGHFYSKYPKGTGLKIKNEVS